MTYWYRILLVTLAVCLFHETLQAEEPELQEAASEETAAIEVASAEPSPAKDSAAFEGLEDLDEALRIRISAKGLRGLNQVIALIESAIDKGLSEEDEGFANSMLADSLMERASSLMQVINVQSLKDRRVKQVRKLVTSDLRRIVEGDDPPAEAQLMLGKILALPDGDPYSARRVLQEYLENEDLDPEKRAEALILRGRLVKDPKKALSDFDEAIKLVPDNESYQLARALLLRTQGKNDEALSAVNEVLESNPDIANALILQGEIYRSLGQTEEAVASFDSATELVPQAASPYQNRGEIFRSQAKFDEAVKQFTKVLELQPGTLITLVHRAEAYLNADKPELALTDIELVLEKQPLIAAHRIRADALSKLDRLNEAISEMEKLAEAVPNEPDLLMQLGLYFIVDGQPDRAVEAYTRVIELDDQNFGALRSRADAYLNIGKHAEAIADFERAIELEPDDTSILNNLAWVLATSPEDDLRNGQRAIELATKACELTKYETPHILSTLAATYAETGDYENAIKWSQKSVDLDDPEHAEQLKKELQSYKDGKPWRERQSMKKEESSEPEEPLTETPQKPPAKNTPVR